MWPFGAHSHESALYHDLYVMNGLRHPQVDILYDKETEKIVSSGLFRPTSDDQILDAMESISDVWERPPDKSLHVFIGLPVRVHGSPTPFQMGVYFLSFFALAQDI